MALTKKVNGVEYEVIRFPMINLNISQGCNGEFSHQGVNALDICGKDTGSEPVYAPCTMKYICNDSYTSGNAIWFQSVNKVLFADGTIDYATFMFIHDDYIYDVTNLATNGYIFSSYEEVLDEGTAGMATGNHSHFEVAKGKYKGMYAKNYTTGVWHLPDSISPDLACVIDGCTVYNHGQPVYSGTKMNWKTSNEIPGIDRIVSTPLPTGGTGKKSEWSKEKDGWVYYNKSGVKVTGWNQLGDKWYWFDSNGVAAEGWKEILYKGKKEWFFFAPENCDMVTGWQSIKYKEEDCSFYFAEAGVMVTGKQVINGKTYNFDSNGVLINNTPDDAEMMTLKPYPSGVDVSAYQPEDFDFTPYDFVILRCAWGTNLDSKFNAFADDLEKKGIPYGVYIYSYSLQPEDGIAEADYVLDVIKGRSITCGVWLDLEWDDYTKNNGGLTKEVQTGVMNNFCQKVKDAGYYVGVYTSPAFITQYLPEIGWPLWLAWWNVEKESFDELPYRDQIVLHQYRGDPLDLDYAYIDLKDLANPEPEKVGCGCCENCKCKK